MRKTHRISRDLEFRRVQPDMEDRGYHISFGSYILDYLPEIHGFKRGEFLGKVGIGEKVHVVCATYREKDGVIEVAHASCHCGAAKQTSSVYIIDTKTSDDYDKVTCERCRGGWWI